MEDTAEKNNLDRINKITMISFLFINSQMKLIKLNSL